MPALLKPLDTFGTEFFFFTDLQITYSLNAMEATVKSNEKQNPETIV